ncbi:MAG: hypothetical protein WCH57_08240 [Verrucomicrobiota bacterium]
MNEQPAPIQRGFALVIVLSLITLAMILAVAFFARSASEYTISKASASSASSSILATTAKEIIINDLRQEIINGSNTPANSNYPVYVPTAPSNAAPARVGTADTLPNLVKRSANGLMFSGTSGAIRASSISTGTASLEGRKFSADRWNAARLLPTVSSTSVTPIADFVLPDWIYLTRSGSNCASATLAAANKSNGSDPILGRFAYTIYDEGGLLDVNCAGYPSGLAATEVGKKGFLALADLTRIGLSGTEVQTLVAWRNASTATAPTNFLTNLRVDPSNFRQVAQGDQAFVSRRQLLNFFTQDGLNQSALPLLGTFSRGLNQPSFGVVGPAISATAALMVSASTNGVYSLASYTGNNLAAQADQTGTNGINPRLLDVRVSGTFNRFNPAQTATLARVGDPLIAKRFPLNRLAWLTYKGPIAPGGSLTSDTTILTPLHNAGLTDDFLSLGTEQNILKAFGLTWAADPAGTGHNVWVYDHGITSRFIGRLSDVAALTGTNAREPDFLELLKATIGVGSLGKGAANSTGVGLWQHARDIQPDFQLLQIFANIIDQYDSDGYPTEIALPTRWTDADLLGLFERKVRGVENLPYLYSMNIGVFTLRQPQFNQPLTPLPLNPTPLVNNTLNDPGLAADILNPWVWNPHSSLSGSSSPQPTSFRIITFSGDPIHSSTNAVTGFTVYTPWTSDFFCYTSFPTTSGTLTGGSMFSLSPYPTTSSDPTELDFSVPGPGYFTQPTALIFPNVPANTNLTTGAGNAIRSIAGGAGGYLTNPVDSNRQYVGVLLATFPICATKFLSGTQPDGTLISGTYLLTANLIRGNFGHSLAAQQHQITSLLQYYSSSNWITCDVKSYLARSAFDASGYINPGSPPADPVRLFSGDCGVAVDPRTMRFGMPSTTAYPASTISTGSASIQTLRPNLSTTNYFWVPGRPGDGIGLGNSPGTLGWIGTLVNTTEYGYYAGFLTENIATLYSAYYDPDRTMRGGMAFYSGPSTLVGKPLATTSAANDTADISRPVILNRPFRSVAELGYVFRDQPFKQLDFFTPSSGDSALLDAFCIKEDQTTDGVIAGKVNLNTRNTQVLDAVLSGVGRDPDGNGSTQITSPETTNLATAICNWTTGTGAFTSLGDVVGRYRNSSYESFYSGSPTPFTGGTTSANNILQRYREAPIRALADVGEVRVWNLLVDVVAQSGFCGPQSNSLAQFSLRGETRLWIHLAIDRATGLIVDQQVELVTE